MLKNVPKVSKSFLEKSIKIAKSHLYWVEKETDSATIRQIVEESASNQNMQVVYLDCRTLMTKEGLRSSIFVENAGNIVLFFDHILEVPETEDSYVIVETIRYILKEGKSFGYEYKKVIATSLCSEVESFKKYRPLICSQSVFKE